MSSLTHKQAAFVREYLIDLNATKAAERAGYSVKTAEKIGSENLKKPEVATAISEAIARRADRVEVKADDILRELLRIATTDIGEAFTEDGKLKKLHEMPLDVRRAIASVEVEEWKGELQGLGVTRKMKFWDKTKSLELLGKHLALFTDKVEHSVTKSLEELLLEARK